MRNIFISLSVTSGLTKWAEKLLAFKITPELFFHKKKNGNANPKQLRIKLASIRFRLVFRAVIMYCALCILYFVFWILLTIQSFFCLKKEIMDFNEWNMAFLFPSNARLVKLYFFPPLYTSLLYLSLDLLKNWLYYFKYRSILRYECRVLV